MKKALLFVVVLLVVIGLFFFFNKRDFTFSFYHWGNSYNSNNIEDKIYIKVLEIDYSNKMEVINTNFITKPKKGSIPVIYITNKAMIKASFPKLLKTVLDSLKATPFAFFEVQFDCDWSVSSRAKYFDFLNEIKKDINKKISATIRLHQIKYAKETGVPPVDYGVLMYYNMSNIGDFNTKNSILDNSIARRYHYNFDKYPLRLKLALPLYSQAVQFRDKKAISIFEGVKESDFSKNFAKVEDNFYRVNKSFYFQGRYIYKDDILRFEDSKFEDIKTAFDDFFSISKNPFSEVIFYTIKYKNRYDLDRLK